jgi:hypothetical protein
MLIEMRREGAIRICLDFINLNRATPKNEYPMPIIDLLIDSASGNKVISFLDGNAGYNQIFMAKEDINKTVFRCLGSSAYSRGSLWFWLEECRCNVSKSYELNLP